MASIAVMFGGIVGFISFLVGLIAFDLSFVGAAALYYIAGCATCALIIGIRLIPSRNDAPDAQTA